MNKEARIKQLFRSLPVNEGVTIHAFKKCLVHISWYEAQKNSTNAGNSRYVFLGMYGFKGYLAELTAQYVGGNGKQLQQYLGNIFTNQRLAQIFDQLQLAEAITYHAKLDYQAQKHIFTLAYLGFVFQHCPAAFVRQLACDWFIKDTDHLLPKTQPTNLVHQLKFKVNQVLQTNIKISIESVQTDGLLRYTTTIATTNDQPLAQHSSRSELYAKKQAVKLALKEVLRQEAAQLNTNAAYQAHLAQMAHEQSQQQQALKQAKQAEYEEKKQRKKDRKDTINAEKRQKAIEEAKKRTINKLKIKQDRTTTKEKKAKLPEENHKRK